MSNPRPIKNETPNVEYVVELGDYDIGYSLFWKTKWRFRRLEDAQWMEKYQSIVKRRIARVVKVETSSV